MVNRPALSYMVGLSLFMLLLFPAQLAQQAYADTFIKLNKTSCIFFGGNWKRVDYPLDSREFHSCTVNSFTLTLGLTLEIPTGNALILTSDFQNSGNIINKGLILSHGTFDNYNFIRNTIHGQIATGTTFTNIAASGHFVNRGAILIPTDGTLYALGDFDNKTGFILDNGVLIVDCDDTDILSTSIDHTHGSIGCV